MMDPSKCRAQRWPALSFALCIGLAAMPLGADTHDWPKRTSPKPETTLGVPHVQVGVEPRSELTAAMLARVRELPGVEIRDTVISLPGAKGFWLTEGIELAQPQAIVGGREFAHVHPDGSLHASLHPKTAKAAVDAGWATPHPWADQRPGWEGFVMVFTPTSEAELDVVLRLVAASHAYVTGRDLN